MSREASGLRLLGVVAGALLLGACVGQTDGPAPPFLREQLAAYGVPSACTADDLALADSFAPLLDDRSQVVALSGGEVLCLTPTAPEPLALDLPVDDARSALGAMPPSSDGSALDAPPPWAGTGTDYLTGGAGSTPSPNQQKGGQTFVLGITTPGGIVQDPTPQPARPGDGDSKNLGTPPAPPPSSSND
jgi:hypothetical protein